MIKKNLLFEIFIIESLGWAHLREGLIHGHFVELKNWWVYLRGWGGWVGLYHRFLRYFIRLEATGFYTAKTTLSSWRPWTQMVRKNCKIYFASLFLGFLVKKKVWIKRFNTTLWRNIQFDLQQPSRIDSC